MPKIESYVCDVCGAIRGEANHWWQMRIENACCLYRWDFCGELDLPDAPLYLCGQSCVQRKVAEFMGTIPDTVSEP